MRMTRLLVALFLFAVPALVSAQPAAGACDRACLVGFVDQYLDALVAQDPKRLPVTANVKFTENGQRLTLGDGFWNSVTGKGTYRVDAADPAAGQVGTFVTMREAPGTPLIMALRLKVENRRISEIEVLLAHSEGGAKNLEALGRPRPGLLRATPPADRMSRTDLVRVANMYFSGMQQNNGRGQYPFADDCDRLENGGQTTNAKSAAGRNGAPPRTARLDPKTSTSYDPMWSCREQFESGLLHFVYRIRDRRYLVVDQERGLVLAFAFFDHPAGKTRDFQTPDGRAVSAGPQQPWTWEIAELFKVEKGLLHEIEAVLERAPYGMTSGWGTWENGMSDKIQYDGPK
jgi:hypothetical protein